jgi:hypothetical protein
MASQEVSFYEPLFAPIIAKLRDTGRMEVEIFIGELLPIVRPPFTGEDVYEAIMVLVETGLIQREESDGTTFIGFAEC